MTIKQALNLAKQDLDSIEARVLIGYILKKNNTYIIANINADISKNDEQELIRALEKIKNGYPLQYITHHQEFMGLNFEVNEDVLIPQPDTEVLVENAIKIILDKYSNKEVKILDLCTGSGAIAISLKKYLPNAKVYASDISKKAIDIAKINAEKNCVKIDFINSDMFENIQEKFDIIVTNPPYIKTDEIEKLSRNVHAEPKLALDGGVDGLEFYKIISKEVKKYLNEHGTLLMEIGFDQGKVVAELFEGSKCIKDYANNDRVVIWNHSQEK